MQRVLVLNSKGGCGKTTIATNLAACYAVEGYSTALLDFDPQASAGKWLSLRPGQRPPIHGVAAHRRPGIHETRAFQLRVPPGTQRVVVDAPAGVTGQALRDCLRDVDTIIIPVLPSPIDIHAVSRFIADLLLEGRVRQRGIRLGVVANRVKEHTRVFQALERFLATLNMPFVTHLRDTQNYVHAAERGLGIHELWDSRVARDKAQWAPLLDWLEQGAQAPARASTA